MSEVQMKNFLPSLDWACKVKVPSLFKALRKKIKIKSLSTLISKSESSAKSFKSPPLSSLISYSFPSIYMEGIIKSQVKDLETSDVYELILDKWRGSSILDSDKVLLESFSSLETLSLTGCGLKSVENFPVLLNLVKLELCDNKIKGSLKALSYLHSLTMLSLAGNQISSLEQLQEIAGLKNLASLDLYGCPVTLANDYSEKVFEMFSGLSVLDGMDKNGDEVSLDEEDDDEDDDEEDEDLEDFIEVDELPLKRRRESDGSQNSECKKVPDMSSILENN